MQSEVGAQFDPVKFGKEITEHICNMGLSKFFPMKCKFLQTIMCKPRDIVETESTPLARLEYLPDLTRLSLYQPILFCGRFSIASYQVLWY
jgi:hypothetical protein